MTWTTNKTNSAGAQALQIPPEQVIKLTNTAVAHPKTQSHKHHKKCEKGGTHKLTPIRFQQEKQTYHALMCTKCKWWS